MAINTTLPSVLPHNKPHPNTDHTFTGATVLLGASGGVAAEFDASEAAVATTIPVRSATAQIKVPTAPVADEDAASKLYVEQIAIAGRAWREPLLVPEQLLAGGSGGVLQAILGYLASNVVANDTFIISDGTITETFTFKAAEAVPFDVLVGGSAAATQTNLIAAINDDSTLWSAIATASLDKHFAGSPAAQMVIYRTAVSANNDRVYGVIAGGQSAIKVVKFNDAAAQHYGKEAGTEENLPSIDPAAKRFGFSRAFAAIRSAETHLVLEGPTVRTYTWDEDDQVWNQTDAGVILQQPIIALAGATPALADLTTLNSAGKWAFAYGTANAAFLCGALNAGGLKKYAVQLGEITS